MFSAYTDANGTNSVINLTTAHIEVGNPSNRGVSRQLNCTVSLWGV